MPNIIIKPPELNSDEIVTIRISENKIFCRTAVYDELFYEHIKHWGFSWNSVKRQWIKLISPESIYDRAAEIGCSLLIEGFIINLDNEKIALKIKNNDFDPEPTRLMDLCLMPEYENYLTVTWIREDLYTCVRHNLYGSKYLKKHKIIVVPIYFHQEIYDFAKEYEFLISERAKIKIEEGKKNIFTLFNIDPPRIKNDTIFQNPPNLTLEKTEIDSELQD